MNQESTLLTHSRWQTSSSLARSAWRVLKLDKGLIGIPALSAVITILITALAGLAIFATSTFNTEPAMDGGALLTGPLVSGSWVSVIFYAALYLALTFAGTYFSAALIAGLLQRFKGETPTVSSAFAAARAHAGALFRFSVLSATIGYILSAIEERVPLAGQIATWIAGAAWSVASMFALPVIVNSNDNPGPFTATRRSVNVIKNTWGETVILNIGIGLVATISTLAFVATTLAVGALTAFIMHISGANAAVTGIGVGAISIIGVIGLVGALLVFTMLSAVVKAAIYHYATTGQAPQGFEQNILRASFTPKQARKVFGAQP